MIVARLALFGALVIGTLIAWSWVRSLRSTWVAKRRGAMGWCIAMLVLGFLFTALKLLIPKI